MTTEPRTLPAVVWFGMDEMRNDGASLGFRDFRPNPAAPEPKEDAQEVVEVEAPKALTPPAPEEIHPSAQESSASLEQNSESPESTAEIPAQENQKTESTATETPATTHPDLDF